MSKRLLFWIPALLLLVLVAYSAIPRRTEMWLRLSVRNQNWETLNEVQLALADRSKHLLASATVELSTGYHVAAMHYRFSRSLDLDRQFAATVE